jgi:hypothetical protein
VLQNNEFKKHLSAHFSILGFTKMIASNNACVRPLNCRPLRRLSGLFTKKVTKSQPVIEEIPTQVKTVNSSSKKTVDSSSEKTVDSCSEKDDIGLGAALRNEKIENARSAARAARQQRQQNAVKSSNMQSALLERLEAKLLVDEMECTELRELVEARRPGIPVSLSIQPINSPSIGDTQLLKKLEALLLTREKECTKVRRLLAQAKKRSEPQTPKGTSNRISLAAHLDAPNTALCRQPSSRSKNSVLRKQKSSRSTKSSTKSVSWE